MVSTILFHQKKLNFSTMLPSLKHSIDQNTCATINRNYTWLSIAQCMDSTEFLESFPFIFHHGGENWIVTGAQRKEDAPIWKKVVLWFPGQSSLFPKKRRIHSTQIPLLCNMPLATPKCWLKHCHVLWDGLFHKSMT